MSRHESLPTTDAFDDEYPFKVDSSGRPKPADMALGWQPDPDERKPVFDQEKEPPAEDIPEDTFSPDNTPEERNQS